MDELKSFIENSLDQINLGIGNNHVRGPILLEIAVTKEIDKGGKLGISVLGIEGLTKAENVSKIKFRVQTKKAISPGEK